jgi:hypothetical protein
MPGWAAEGADMSVRLSRLLGRKPGGRASAAIGRRDSSDIPLASALGGLALLAIVMVGAVGWLATAVEDDETADGDLAQLTLDNSGSPTAGDEDGTEPSRGFASVVPGVAEGPVAPGI